MISVTLASLIVVWCNMHALLFVVQSTKSWCNEIERQSISLVSCRYQAVSVHVDDAKRWPKRSSSCLSNWLLRSSAACLVWGKEEHSIISKMFTPTTAQQSLNNVHNAGRDGKEAHAEIDGDHTNPVANKKLPTLAWDAPDHVGHWPNTAFWSCWTSTVEYVGRIIVDSHTSQFFMSFHQVTRFVFNSMLQFSNRIFGSWWIYNIKNSTSTCKRTSTHEKHRQISKQKSANCALMQDSESMLEHLPWVLSNVFWLGHHQVLIS